MPDVTSTLLAMYQQIIGGSTAREQSSLEAECARRVILSGLSIGAAGNIFSGTANLTIGSLNVLGNTTIGGVLAVTGFGNHQFLAGGVGGNSLIVQNTAAGAGNYASVSTVNDSGAQLSLQTYSSLFAPTGTAFASGNTLVGSGAGGLSVWANGGNLRLYTGAAVQRLIINAGGFLAYNVGLTLNAQASIGFDGTITAAGLAIQNFNAGNTGAFHWFVNSAGGVAGNIAQTAALTVAYNTTSDARLKRDLGPAIDVSALRGVAVHDFLWHGDDTLDRGVFAQEAIAFFPRAVVAGTDETTDAGDLKAPWMTDYSKFVPDLIVGWQQHDHALAQLSILMADLRTKLRGAYDA